MTVTFWFNCCNLSDDQRQISSFPPTVVLEETAEALPLNIPIDHQGLIARMCASPLNPSDVTEATSVTFEQLEIPADSATSMETTQIVIVHTIQAE